MSLCILYDDWSPGLTISKVLQAIESLMSEPDPDNNPLKPELAAMFNNDRALFNSNARQFTHEFAD